MTLRNDIATKIHIADIQGMGNYEAADSILSLIKEKVEGIDSKRLDARYTDSYYLGFDDAIKKVLEALK